MDFCFNLKYPFTQAEIDMITDADLEHTTEISLYNRKGEEVRFIKPITCSECKHLEVINGAKIYAHCPMWEIDFYPFEDDTRTNYCSWGKRKTDVDRKAETDMR